MRETVLAVVDCLIEYLWMRCGGFCVDPQPQWATFVVWLARPDQNVA
jgi:hypothetical protein